MCNFLSPDEYDIRAHATIDHERRRHNAMQWSGRHWSTSGPVYTHSFAVTRHAQRRPSRTHCDRTRTLSALTVAPTTALRLPCAPAWHVFCSATAALCTCQGHAHAPSDSASFPVLKKLKFLDCCGQHHATTTLCQSQSSAGAVQTHSLTYWMLFQHPHM
jgi:hypothetical protein